MNKENYNSDVYLKERQLIQAAANKNRLVVFVGAGTSIPSGMPSWSKAVEKIREHLSDKNYDNDFLRVPQYYYNEHGKNNYVELMREIFKYGKNLYPRDIHHKKYDKNLISSIVAELKNYVDLHDVAINWNRIAILFQSVINQNRDFTEDDNELLNTLSDFLEFVMESFKSMTLDGSRVKQNVQNVLYTGIRLHNKIQKKEFSSKSLSNILQAEYIETLAIIYPLLDDDYKKEIKKLASLHQWEVGDNNFYNVYLLVQNKVISIDEELEKSILSYLHGLEDDRKTTFPGKYEQALQYITNLYTGDFLKDKSAFEVFIQQSGDDFLKFVIAPQNFDGDSFKLEWLKYLSKGFLDKLNSNESLVKTIRRKVTKEYSDGCLDDTIMNIYFEFFSCDKIS